LSMSMQIRPMLKGSTYITYRCSTFIGSSLKGEQVNRRQSAWVPLYPDCLAVAGRMLGDTCQLRLDGTARHKTIAARKLI
jgi:hypothetical protein